ncbi:hypothetical protein Q5P01_006337 [Channa striata]|uniref:Ig-like domain-containing protein n=1 Tax=Channa striata TaxID=64152 RepID=A0AA88NCQ8_CHASR|nr:hypothetical protein Q5P01_006337 [Channa striata]
MVMHLPPLILTVSLTLIRFSCYITGKLARAQGVHPLQTNVPAPPRNTITMPYRCLLLRNVANICQDTDVLSSHLVTKECDRRLLSVAGLPVAMPGAHTEIKEVWAGRLPREEALQPGKAQMAHSEAGGPGQELRWWRVREEEGKPHDDDDPGQRREDRRVWICGLTHTQLHLQTSAQHVALSRSEHGLTPSDSSTQMGKTQGLNMAAADILCFTVWIATVFSTGLGCPQLCICSDKHSRHFADCAYKDLTEIPDEFPPNVTTVSLSVNKISLIPLGSFDNVTQVTSLWMARNEITSIERGALAPLVHLYNFDISHNKIVDFPWEDLKNLRALQLLKLNHNEMVHLPRDAFSNLKDLRSLRLNNNKFATIAEGTFDGLVSLSHVQIYNNPYACTCSLNWLRNWIITTTISVQEENLITCATPDNLKGEVIRKLPESKCTSPKVTIRTEPNIHNDSFFEDSTLALTCEVKGNPKPLVMWNIHSKSQKQELALSFTEDDSAQSSEDPLTSQHPVRVFNNGTLVISQLRKEDGGNYSCSATNEFGRAEELVVVEVVASPNSPPIREMTTTPSKTKTEPFIHPKSNKVSVFDSVRLPDVKGKNTVDITPTFPLDVRSHEEETNYPSHASKCGLTANTRYISSHSLNGSLDDIKQYTFDFGVIALGVSETEATVRLNPLLIPREKGTNRAATVATPGSINTDSEEHRGLSHTPEKVHSNGLYLCVTSDRKHSAVQWSRIKEGVNTYLFSGLRPATNYSLCLTYRGEDCEVQVLFTTRRRVPNLLIIISVSICLLTVSTVPLLGATCFHLVYKYRSKTYKLILKAKDQYHMERNLTVNFNIHAPHTESKRKINGSQLDEEEGETESCDGDKEADTEESVVTDSFTLSQGRANLDDCEVGSEYSDRLPLGAEAVNITSNYKYPSQ